MKKIKIFQVDSFTEKRFGGNPAGVCVFDKFLPDDLMQSIAFEKNLSETAFCVPKDGKDFEQAGKFDLRWFTPLVEVKLCGHATLAAAKILFDEYGNRSRGLHFSTKSGELIVERADDRLRMNFPGDPVDKAEISEDFLMALGIENPVETAISRNLIMILIEVESPEIVKNLNPNFGDLKAAGEKSGNFGVLVTSRWEDQGFDIISRFFAPAFGIDEDPVTGAAHTVLGPYWSAKLHKDTIKSYQASKRGGIVEVTVKGDRVDLIGQAVVVMESEMRLV